MLVNLACDPEGPLALMITSQNAEEAGAIATTDKAAPVVLVVDAAAPSWISAALELPNENERRAAVAVPIMAATHDILNVWPGVQANL
jgi:hypothetical protein